MKNYIALLSISSMFLLVAFQKPDHPTNTQIDRTDIIVDNYMPDDTTRSHFYLTQFSYTPATWARLMKNPENRQVAAARYIESVGGKLHGFWYAFGSFDGYCIWEAPDNISMAAVGLAITGGGALSKFETIPLLTVEETLEALRRSQKVGYKQPGE